MTTSARSGSGRHTPLVSVVMPCYSESIPVLERAISSILSQTLRDIELIVVVDNPERTDLRAHLDSYSAGDSRIRVLANPENMGVWPSYNRGVKAARGLYIAIQDADDASLPRRLEKLVRFLEENPDVGVVGCGLEYIDAKSEASLAVRRYPETIDREIRRRCPLAHATTVRKADLYEKFGFYDESDAVRHAADYELWCRWFAQGVTMANIPDCEYSYFQSSENFKARNVRPILRDTIAIKRRYARKLRFSPMDRAYLFAESLAVLLPSQVIVAMFYFTMARRSKGLDPHDRAG